MIIITGTIAYDYIMDFPGKFSDHILPEQLHAINLSFIVDTFEKRRGGTAGNISYSLGLLNIPHILFSVAGDDFEEYKKKFNELKIDTSHVRLIDNKHSSTGFAMTDEKDNQIWGYFYGASDGIKDLKLGSVAQKEDFVVVGPSGAAGSMSLVSQCIELGTPYLFDPGFILTQINDADLITGVSHAAILIGNDYEIALIKKRVPDFDELKKQKTVITTLGEKGAKIEQKGQEILISACPVKKIVDPTGAGDAWRAGFLAGFSKNRELKICGQMGSVAASFAIEQYGTQEHIFSKEEFVSRYRQAFSDTVEW